MSRRLMKPAFLILSFSLTIVFNPNWAVAQDQHRLNLEEATEAFNRLTNRDRNELYLMLMATGDFNAMASNQFSGRLYDAVASFQQKNGIFPTGITTSETLDRLNDVGGRIFNSWGFEFIDHPHADASVAIPKKFNLNQTNTPRGLSFENTTHTMSINFAFFPSDEAGLSEIYARLTQPAPGRRIDMKVIKQNFFAVAGGSANTGNYSRYIPVRGGISGFTISWNSNAYPNAGRIAVVMANELYARHMNDQVTVADMFETTPADPPVDQGRYAKPQANQTLGFSEPTPANPLSGGSSQGEQDTRDQERQAANERQRQRRQDDEDKAQQEAQAARKDAIEKLRQARFDRATSSAKEIIDIAAAFVKSYPNNPNLIDYLQKIATLNQSLSGNDPEMTEKDISELTSSLRHDTDYTKFEIQRIDEQKQKNARYLADALKALKQQKIFLIGIVTQNPTSQNAFTFLPLIKQADSLLTAPDLGRLQVLIGQIDLSIQNAGLKSEFSSSQSDEAHVTSSGPTASDNDIKPNDKLEPSAKEITATLASTGKNKFLMIGDLQDIVILYNSSPSAPHVYKNLRGDIVFDGGRADACLFGHGDEEASSGIVKSTLSPYGLKTLAFTGALCDSDRLKSYDIVALRRGTFLRQDLQYALVLVKAVETDQFKELTTVTETQVRTASAADAVEATEIAGDVDRGARDGFGLLLLQTQSPALCLVAKDQTETHEKILESHHEKIVLDMGLSPTYAVTTADGAFINAKHGQCGAIYAAAADLKDIVNGLKRDQTPFRFSTLWVQSSDVKTLDDKLEAERLVAEQQRAARQRSVEEARKLAAIQADEAASKRSAQQQESRSQYGAIAKAAAAHIAQEVRDFTENPKDPDQIAVKEFPTFAANFRSLLSQQWELLSENSELFDYGTSNWKGRSLETVVTKVQIKYKNGPIGDYKDECSLFGQIRDAEFSFERDPIVVPCEQEERLTKWEEEHAFKSQWVFR